MCVKRGHKKHVAIKLLFAYIINAPALTCFHNIHNIQMQKQAAYEQWGVVWYTEKKFRELNFYSGVNISTTNEV